MKRRTALKLSLLGLAATYASAKEVCGFTKEEMKKIVNTIKMKKKDPAHPTAGELKHTPEISLGDVDKNGYMTVSVVTGEDGHIHPSVEGHWIYEIELYANGKKVASESIQPVISTGYLAAKVKKEGLKELRAVSKCSLHGIWENTLKV